MNISKRGRGRPKKYLPRVLINPPTPPVEAPTMLKIEPLPELKDDFKIPESNQSHVLPVHPFRCVISGNSGSGKTVLLNNLVLKPEYYAGFFKYILVISPNVYADKSYKHLLKFKDEQDKILARRMFTSKNKPVKVMLYTEYEPESIARVMDYRQQSVEKGNISPMLVILDDVLEQRALINSPFLQALFTRGRHMHISTFILTQSYMKIPRTLRLNTTNTIVFAPNNLSEVQRIYDELVRNLTLNQFVELCKHVYKQRYSFLHFRIGKPIDEYLTYKLEYFIVPPE